jgi:prefoldin subunit 5
LASQSDPAVERAFLQSQAQAIQAQLDAIQQRLDDLKTGEKAGG